MKRVPKVCKKGCYSGSGGEGAEGLQSGCILAAVAIAKSGRPRP